MCFVLFQILFLSAYNSKPRVSAKYFALPTFYFKFLTFTELFVMFIIVLKVKTNQVILNIYKVSMLLLLYFTLVVFFQFCSVFFLH